MDKLFVNSWIKDNGSEWLHDISGAMIAEVYTSSYSQTIIWQVWIPNENLVDKYDIRTGSSSSVKEGREMAIELLLESGFTLIDSKLVVMK